MKKRIVFAVALSCLILTVHAQLPNAGFEEWDSSTIVNGTKVYDPTHWFSRNAEMIGIGKAAPVSITKDAHSGNYAVKIVTITDDNEKYAGMLVSGYTEGSELAQLDKGEKFRLTGRIKSYSGWYKYIPASELDSFKVALKFYLKGKSYGSAYFTGGATNEYKQFIWELTYPDNIPNADSAKFVIISSSYDANEGTELILDDLDVQYKTPTGLNEPKNPLFLSLYPNPALDQITLFGLPPKVKAILVTNSQGAIVKQPSIVAGVVDIADLYPGFYWMVVTDENGFQSTAKFSKL